MKTVEELVERARARAELPPPTIRRAVRRAAGVSQTEGGTVCGVTRQTFALWERGVSDPRGAHLEAYADFLRRLQEVVR